MSAAQIFYDVSFLTPSLVLREQGFAMRENGIEDILMETLRCQKCKYRPNITTHSTLAQNFGEKCGALNRVRLTHTEFNLMLDKIVTTEVFTATKALRGLSSFTRDNCSPLNDSTVKYTDVTEDNKANIQRVLPEENLRGFKMIFYVNRYFDNMQIRLRRLFATKYRNAAHKRKVIVLCHHNDLMSLDEVPFLGSHFSQK